MFRKMIRWGIVATLAMAALVIPEAPAQTVSVRDQIWSTVERADAFKKQAKLPQAAREYEQALDLARQHLGPEDLTTAAVMNNLASLYDDMGRYADAEPLFKRSLAIRETKLGCENRKGVRNRKMAFLHQCARHRFPTPYPYSRSTCLSS